MMQTKTNTWYQWWDTFQWWDKTGQWWDNCPTIQAVKICPASSMDSKPVHNTPDAPDQRFIQPKYHILLSANYRPLDHSQYSICPLCRFHALSRWFRTAVLDDS